MRPPMTPPVQQPGAEPRRQDDEEKEGSGPGLSADWLWRRPRIRLKCLLVIALSLRGLRVGGQLLLAALTSSSHPSLLAARFVWSRLIGFTASAGFASWRLI